MNGVNTSNLGCIYMTVLRGQQHQTFEGLGSVMI